MRMEQSSMLFPATIISILHALWSGLRWMQLVHSASTTFSREVNRYKGKNIGTPNIWVLLPTICLFVCTESWGRKRKASPNIYWQLLTATCQLSLIFCFTAIWSCPFTLHAFVWLVNYAYAKMEQLICWFYVDASFSFLFSWFCSI